MKKTFYITTPIYYPSGELHIGHLYTTSLAWTIRNYKRARGYDAKMLTGSDEHGQKIEKKSIENNLSCQEYVDSMNQKFLDLWTAMDIDFDYFSRTTNQTHKDSVQNIFKEMLNNSDIYQGEYEGLYSVEDEEYVTKTQAIKKNDDYYHYSSGHKLVPIKEKSYLLNVKKYEQWIKEYLIKNDVIYPEITAKELFNNFINKGLQDLSLSRTNFTWGVQIPGDEESVIYVWLDALTNYINTLGYPNGDDFKKYWKNGDEVVHIVGKEISRFHCIYWPIILNSLSLRQPTKIISHGWLVTSEGKMSKSKGNVINPLDLLKNYDPEFIKYFFVSQIKIGSDGIFEEELFKNCYNADLANNFGNLVSRTITMASNSFPNGISYVEKLESIDEEVYEFMQESYNQYTNLFDEYKIDEALQQSILLSKHLNGYIDKTEPWLLKDDLERLSIILTTLLNGIYYISYMLRVVMPKNMNIVLEHLNLKSWNENLLNKNNKFEKIVLEKKNPIFLRKK